jgi:DNA-binding IclR family transcriptional regulator
MTPGIRGIGVAIPGKNGHSFAAISIGSIAERMTKQRSLELRELLLREASGLTDLISAGPSRTPDQ